MAFAKSSGRQAYTRYGTMTFDRLGSVMGTRGVKPTGWTKQNGERNLVQTYEEK